MTTIRSLGPLVLSLGLAVSAGPAAAQSPPPSGTDFQDLPRLGIGYVANAPNMFLGVSAYGISSYRGGWGLYVDFKKSTSSPRDGDDFVDTLTAAESEALGHFQNFDDFAWWSANAALIRPVKPGLLVYLGAGFTHEAVYYRYSSMDRDLGNFGRYWVADEEASGGLLNVLGGVFLRMGDQLAFQFGFESEPSGITVGGSYSRAWNR